jgi:hypothetical protein
MDTYHAVNNKFLPLLPVFTVFFHCPGKNIFSHGKVNPEDTRNKCVDEKWTKFAMMLRSPADRSMPERQQP